MWIEAIQKAQKFHSWFRLIKNMKFDSQSEREIIGHLLLNMLDKNETSVLVNYEIDEESKDVQEVLKMPSSPINNRIKAQHLNRKNKVEGEVGFDSFRMIELVGEGSFGKVYRVKMKSTGVEYAMKVKLPKFHFLLYKNFTTCLKLIHIIYQQLLTFTSEFSKFLISLMKLICRFLNKSFLVKNKVLKYASSECSILRQMSNEFIVNLHYAFQTPNNLYMVLDY